MALRDCHELKLMTTLLKWSLATWSKHASTSMITKFGEEIDKANIPPSKTYRPRVHRVKRLPPSPSAVASLAGKRRREANRDDNDDIAEGAVRRDDIIGDSDF